MKLLAAAALIILCSLTAHADLSLVYQDTGRSVWRIDRPNVTVPREDYPQITFLPNDEVIVRAGGCAQTGGAGDTWKRYVNPSGGATDRLYHGKIFIPGATAGMVRISSITSPYQPQPLHLMVNKLPPHYDGASLYLQLGYEDEDYGDNGYWGHDDGNFDQCKYENDGGPAWLEITIIHHFSPLPSPTPIAPMDLWWEGADDNYFPLNPTWWYHVVNGSVPNANSICRDFHNENDSLPAGKSDWCTLWDPEVNERGFFSLCAPQPHTVAGHINWAPATYTGDLYFKDFSGSFPQDADYNWTLLRPDSRGVTTPTEFMAAGSEGVGLEFNSNETVDRMEGTGTWWDWLHHTVDHDQDSIKGRYFGKAVVVGLLGLDHAHAAHAELHPVYGLAINISETADYTVWAVFARNLGNEGSCSQQLEPLWLKNDRISIFIPRPADTTVSESGSRFYKSNLDASGYTATPFDDGVLLSRNLGSPWNRGLFWGELRLKKEKADLVVSSMTASPNPVITGSNIRYTITVTNNGPDTARGVKVSDPRHTRLVGTLLTGTSRTVSWLDQADCSLADGAVISNTATVAAATLDPNPVNNSATAETTASNPPPVFTSVPPDVTAYTGPRATECGTVVSDATIGQPTVTDNCPGVVVTRSGVPADNFFPVGVTTITYTATDSGGATTTATQKVTVIDNTPPVIVAPPVTAYTGTDPQQASPNCGVVVSDATLAAVITDNCPGVTYTRTGVPPDNFFPVGVTTITYVATDAHGNQTTATQDVTVIDNTPPVISNQAVDKPALWPPDHQMESVAVAYDITDNCPLPPAPCVLTVASNEPASGTGPGDLAPDWRVLDARHVLLRAERAAADAPRVYTITNTCTDSHGNVVSSQTESIVPTAGPLIEPDKTQQGETIERPEVEHLPNVGRDFAAYVFTLPGVLDSGLRRRQRPGFLLGGSGFSVGGSGGLDNEVTVDGGEDTDGSGGIRFRLSPEAVQEVRVNRNSYPAEFGLASGAAVEFVTRAGTNDYHGGAYLFYQPEATTARNPLDNGPENRTDQQAAAGFTLGGPFVRGKLFYFTNYEHRHTEAGQFRSYTSATALGPNASQTALLDRLDASPDPNVRRISGNLRAALTTSPATYPATFNLLLDNSSAFVRRESADTLLARVDGLVGNSDSVTGRFSFFRQSDEGFGPFWLATPNGTYSVNAKDYTALLKWTHEFDIDLINRALIQFAPDNSLKLTPRDRAATSLFVTDLARFGQSFGGGSRTTEDRFQFDDTLTWIRHDHTPKFGASYRPVRFDVRDHQGFGGEWFFTPGAIPVTEAVPAADRPAFLAAAGASTLPALNGIQSFNLNLPSLYSQTFGDPAYESWAQRLGIFASDTWKTGKDLTLEYGARFDFDAGPSPLPRHAHFSPRVGFAWDILGEHRTVLRGGAGVFYATSDYRAAALTSLFGGDGGQLTRIIKTPADGAQSPASIYNAARALGRPPLDALSEADLRGLGVQTGLGATGRVIFRVDPDYTNPYSVQASLSLQRQLTSDTSIELAYQMYRGVNLPVFLESNYREAATPNPFGAAFGPFYDRIDPAIAQLNVYRSAGSSSYHGLVVSAAKRAGGNFQFRASYTFSKALDDLVGVQTGLEAAAPTRLFLERGRSDLDIRHHFVASGILFSPFKGGPGAGWPSRALADLTLSSILTIRSGPPFTLQAGADLNGDTHLSDRVLVIGRNTGIGPSFSSLDLRLTRLFSFASADGLRLGLTFEAQNLFNHSNFAALNNILGADLNSPDYLTGTFRLAGQRDRTRTQPLGFTDAFAARRFQFGLRVIF